MAQGCRVRYERGLPRRADTKPVRLDAGTHADLKEICGADFAPNGDVCCDASQITALTRRLRQVRHWTGECPACWNNYRDVFCQLECSPYQHMFLDVSESEGRITNASVLTTSMWKEQLYNSCKDVKVGSHYARIVDLLGGAATDAGQFVHALGQHQDLPFPIEFETNANATNFVPPLRNCSDAASDARCGCSNCLTVCPTVGFPLEPMPCRIGGWTCTDAGLGILYWALLVALGLYWVLVKYRRGTRGEIELPEDPVEDAHPLSQSRSRPVSFSGDRQGATDAGFDAERDTSDFMATFRDHPIYQAFRKLQDGLTSENGTLEAFFPAWGALCARQARYVLLVTFVFCVFCIHLYSYRDWEMSITRLMTHDWNWGDYEAMQAHRKSIFRSDAFLVDAATEKTIFWDVPISDDDLQRVKPVLTYDRIVWWTKVEDALNAIRMPISNQTWSEFCTAQPDPSSCSPTSVLRVLRDVKHPDMPDHWRFELDDCLQHAQCAGNRSMVLHPVQTKEILSGIPSQGKPSDARAAVMHWNVRHHNATGMRRWGDALGGVLEQIAGHAPVVSFENGKLHYLEHPLSKERRALGLQLVITSPYSWEKEMEHLARPEMHLQMFPYLLAFVVMLYSTLRPQPKRSVQGMSTSIRWHRRLRFELVRRYHAFLKSSRFGLVVVSVFLSFCSIAFTNGIMGKLDVTNNWATQTLIPPFVLGLGMMTLICFHLEAEHQMHMALSALQSEALLEASDNENDSETDEDGVEHSPDADVSVADDMPTHLELHHGQAPPLTPFSTLYIIQETVRNVAPMVLLRTLFLTVALMLCLPMTGEATRHVPAYAAMSLCVLALLQLVAIPAVLAIDTSLVLRRYRREDGTESQQEPTKTNLDLALYQWLRSKNVQAGVLSLALAFLFWSLALWSRLEVGMATQAMVRKASPLHSYLDMSDRFAMKGPELSWKHFPFLSNDSGRTLCNNLPGCKNNSLNSVLMGARVSSPWFNEVIEERFGGYASWLDPMNDMCCRVRRHNTSQLCAPDERRDACRPCMEGRSPPWNINLTSHPGSKENYEYMRQYSLFIPSEACPYGDGGLYGDLRWFDDTQSVMTDVLTTITMPPLRTYKDRHDAMTAIHALMTSKTTNYMTKPVIPEAATLQEGYHARARLALVLLPGLAALLVIACMALPSFRLALLTAGSAATITAWMSMIMWWKEIPVNTATIQTLSVTMALSAATLSGMVHAYEKAPSPTSTLVLSMREERIWRTLYTLHTTESPIRSGTGAMFFFICFTLVTVPLASIGTQVAWMWSFYFILMNSYALTVFPVLISLFGGSCH